MSLRNKRPFVCSERFIIGVGIAGGQKAFFGLVTGCQIILKLLAEIVSSANREKVPTCLKSGYPTSKFTISIFSFGHIFQF